MQIVQNTGLRIAKFVGISTYNVGVNILIRFKIQIEIKLTLKFLRVSAVLWKLYSESSVPEPALQIFHSSVLLDK